MMKKLLANLAAVGAAAGLLAGGGSATALAAGAASPAAAHAAVISSSASKVPGCGPLEPLVANGTITHAQAIAIRNGLISYVRDHWRNVLDTVLGQQVKNHTITKAQASEVAGAITSWIHKYRGEEHHHYGACHHGHDESMMRGSGNR
jgi:hypothetical protein